MDTHSSAMQQHSDSARSLCAMPTSTSTETTISPLVTHHHIDGFFYPEIAASAEQQPEPIPTIPTAIISTANAPENADPGSPPTEFLFKSEVFASHSRDNKGREYEALPTTRFSAEETADHILSLVSSDSISRCE